MEGCCCALQMWSMPGRREMPPVEATLKLVRVVQERAYTSMSARSAMLGDISPPLNASLFMILSSM